MADSTLLAAAGLGVGLIVGMTGVGAGSVMTPLLIAGFGVPAPVAVGTDLAAAAVSKTAGTIAHRFERNVAHRIVALLAAGSIPAALATLVALSALALTPDALTRLIRTSVGVALVVSIAALLSHERMRRRAVSPHRFTVRWRGLLTVVIGAAIGAAVVVSSLGAGAIGAACLAILYPELEPAEIAGSDIAHAVPLTVIATAGHAWLGTIDIALLLALLAGSIPGVVAGSLLARSVPTRWLRAALIGALAFAALKLLR